MERMVETYAYLVAFSFMNIEDNLIIVERITRSEWINKNDYISDVNALHNNSPFFAPLLCKRLIAYSSNI